MKYQVTFEFFSNQLCRWRADSLTNNGEGMTLDDAEYTFEDFRRRDNIREVRIEPLGTPVRQPANYC